MKLSFYKIIIVILIVFYYCARSCPQAEIEQAQNQSNLTLYLWQFDHNQM